MDDVLREALKDIDDEFIIEWWLPLPKYDIPVGTTYVKMERKLVENGLIERLMKLRGLEVRRHCEEDISY